MSASGSADPVTRISSPILSIERGEGDVDDRFETHSHPEHKLLWSATATVLATTSSRDWLIPPGYGLWIPGGVEHGGAVLRPGEGAAITFAAGQGSLAWTEPTGVRVGPLLGELITYLHQVEPQEPGRPHAEALMFMLLTPQPAHDIQVSMPTDPRARAVAERLVADPADQRELGAWADYVHAGVRTLSRLFVNETGLSFARWRTHVRIRAAIGMLADGVAVKAVAHAVGVIGDNVVRLNSVVLSSKATAMPVRSLLAAKCSSTREAVAATCRIPASRSAALARIRDRCRRAGRPGSAR
ncbi:hypothetical protein GCM10011588_25880 [Nocardia jinanensis]|uniref:HTH araC/xylS-type domain-containing protein n=1 Tax=Nocardia jinanensis TaxID=382504 RepID=A0A917RIN6_9NOCA|nr:hypothetical protein GCM10011588_25880 [Nocardia jinanensis]